MVPVFCNQIVDECCHQDLGEICSNAEAKPASKCHEMLCSTGDFRLSLYRQRPNQNPYFNVISGMRNVFLPVHRILSSTSHVSGSTGQSYYLTVQTQAPKEYRESDRLHSQIHVLDRQRNLLFEDCIVLCPIFRYFLLLGKSEMAYQVQLPD